MLGWKCRESRHCRAAGRTLEVMNAVIRKNKRAVTWLGGFFGVYILVFQIAMPFYDMQGAIGSQIASRRLENERYKKALEQRAAYAEQLHQIESMVDAYQSHFLDAADENAAALSIEEAVRSIASQTQIRVTRSNPLPSRKIGDKYLKIGVQLNLDGGYDDLVSFVHAVSEHEKFLVIDEFNMTSLRVRQETRLNPRLKISGFIRLS